MAKNTIPAYQDPIVLNKDMSASFTGTPSNIEFYDNVGIQVSWTGANPTGTINVEISLDYNPRFPSAGTWTFLANSGTPIVITPAGTPDNGYFDLNQLSATWVRLIYTTAGGSVGTLNSKLSAKSI